MRTLVATNIKQSFAKLVENNTAVDATFALLAGQDPDDQECLLIEACVPFRPILNLEGDTIHCAQDGFPGFYALQQSALQLLKSVNFYPARPCSNDEIALAGKATFDPPHVHSMASGQYSISRHMRVSCRRSIR